MIVGLETEVDLFTPEAMSDPYPVYKEIGDLGPAVWSTKHNVWCVARYDDVKRVLADYQTFTRAKGVGLNEEINVAMSGPGKANSLTSDPPLRDEIRRFTSAPLLPRSLSEEKAASIKRHRSWWTTSSAGARSTR